MNLGTGGSYETIAIVHLYKLLMPLVYDTYLLRHRHTSMRIDRTRPRIEVTAPTTGGCLL